MLPFADFEVASVCYSIFETGLF